MQVNDRVMVWVATAADQGAGSNAVVETYILEATATDHSMLRPDRWETITATVTTGGTATIQVIFGLSSNYF